MEVQETIKPETEELNFDNIDETVNIKKYELVLDNNIYFLIIEILSKDYQKIIYYLN